MQNEEKSSFVRDFHTAHAFFLQLDPSLTWHKLQEMSRQKVSSLQHDLTAMLHKTDVERLLPPTANYPGALPAMHYNWLNSLQSKEAGLWLTVNRTYGFKFTSEEFQVALLHRLLGPQHSLTSNLRCKCNRGDGHIDRTAHHLFTGCSRGGVRQITHDSITLSIFNMLRVHGVHARREVLIFKEDNPDSKSRMDIVITEGQLGSDKKILLDITVTNPINRHSRHNRIQQNGAANAAFAGKMKTYGERARQANYTIPVVQVLDETNECNAAERFGECFFKM